MMMPDSYVPKKKKVMATIEFRLLSHVGEVMKAANLIANRTGVLVKVTYRAKRTGEVGMEWYHEPYRSVRRRKQK